VGKISRSGRTETNDIRMPRATVDVRNSAMSVDYLLLNYEQFLEKERQCYPWAEKFVMGFPLPSWQRGFVWTEAQQKRFILSIWNKGDLGSYLVNGWEMSSAGIFNRFSNILQDGQQRLTTIERYVSDQLAVEDCDGVPRYWRDLSKREQRRFGSVSFCKCEVTVWDEAQLRELYDLRNFSGTAHLDSERAAPIA
jgi:hypothetical protein